MHKLIIYLKGIKWHIVVLVLFFLTIRLPYLDDRFKFEVEHADDFRALQAIWSQIKSGELNRLSVVGQEATYSGDSHIEVYTPVYHGVFYYYLHLPFAIIAQFSPSKLLYIKLVFELIAVVMLYQVGIKLFKSKIYGLITAFIYSSLFWGSVYSRYIWTPSTVPIFAIYMIYGLVFWKSGKPMIFLAAISSAIASQVQFGAYWLIIYLLVFLVIKRIIFNWSNFFVIIVGILLPTWPSLVNELRNGFLAVNTLIKSFETTNLTIFTEGQKASDFLVEFGYIFLRITESITYGEMYLYALQPNTKILSVLTMLTIFGSGIMMKSNHLMVKLSLLLFIPFPYIIAKYYLYADPKSYPRIIEILTPIINNLNYMIPFISIAIVAALYQLYKFSVPLGLSFVISLLLIVHSNSSAIAENFYTQKSIDYDAGDKIFVSKIIATHSASRPFSLDVTAIGPRNDEWVYLLKSYTNSTPVLFNGTTEIGHSRYPQQLSGDNPDVTYEIIDRRYDFPLNKNGWTLVTSKGVYELWTKKLHE